MLVETQTATSAGHAIKKSNGDNPFAGLVASGGNVDVEVNTDPRVVVEFVYQTGETNFSMSNPQGVVLAWAPVVARASLGWSQGLAVLPPSGPVAAGTYWLYGDEICYVIQAHDRSVYGGDPFQPGREALTRLFRDPWRIYAWKQPLDQYDAWKLANAITGAPDQCNHLGRRWRVSGADAGGNNVWEPGTYGWTDIGPA